MEPAIKAKTDYDFAHLVDLQRVGSKTGGKQWILFRRGILLAAAVVCALLGVTIMTNQRNLAQALVYFLPAVVLGACSASSPLLGLADQAENQAKQGPRRVRLWRLRRGHHPGTPSVPPPLLRPPPGAGSGGGPSSFIHKRRARPEEAARQRGRAPGEGPRPGGGEAGGGPRGKAAHTKQKPK